MKIDNSEDLIVLDWWINGIAILIPVVTAADTFTASNGTVISSRAMNSGDSWTLQTGNITVENNTIHSPLNTISIATFNKSWADVSIKADISLLQVGEEISLIFRYVDLNNYWRACLMQGGNGIRIIKKLAGVETFIFRANPASPANFAGPETVELFVVGDTATFYTPYGNLVQPGINSLGSGSTIHGLYFKKGSTDANDPVRGNLDNFRAYSFLSSEPPNLVNKLVIDAPSTRQILQRNGTTANINISGRFLSDGVGHDIEASFNGGSYQTITTNNGGSFSGILTNQPQGQGSLTVRLKDNTTISKTILFVGIGDVYLSCGQSNAADTGLLTNKQTYSHAILKAGMFAGTYRYENLFDPVSDRVAQLDTVSITSPTPNGSYAPLLATLFMADQNVPIGIVSSSAGGTSISMWQKGASATDRTTLFGSAVYRALQQPNGIKAVLMHQGESDVLTGSVTAPTTVTTLMSQFVADIYNALGVPVVISKIHKWDGSPTTNQTDVNNWHTAIDNVISSNPHALLGADFDLPTRVGAGLHFTSNSEGLDAATRLWNRLKILFY